MKALGICVGASTISMAGLERKAGGEIATLDVRVEPHHGNPRRYLVEMLDDIDASRYDRVSVTGRNFRQFLNLSSIPEPQAVEQALVHLNGRGENLEAVVSAGGETFLVYALGRDGRLIWEHKSPDFITSDLAILPTKVLLAGSIDGTLLAFRIDQPMSQKAWWAKYLGNLANSGFDE